MDNFLRYYLPLISFGISIYGLYAYRQAGAKQQHLMQMIEDIHEEIDPPPAEHREGERYE